jgi:hypothetical protein
MSLILPEIESSVGKDTQNRDSKALIESLDAVFFEDLRAAISQPCELPLISSSSNVSS